MENNLKYEATSLQPPGLDPAAHWRRLAERALAAQERLAAQVQDLELRLEIERQRARREALRLAATMADDAAQAQHAHAEACEKMVLPPEAFEQAAWSLRELAQELWRRAGGL